jgi:tetratricopeptide (TPR) repeat protein
MTTRTEAPPEKSFVKAPLPWIIAGILAVVYLLTINHWISFKSLQSVARASGQLWTPDVYTPLFNLVTSPFHWLPETWVPLAMNLFSVVCAFFVLALLARSVALLPHDRTEKQREREHSPFALLSAPLAWVPPVLAVLVCGLQLTFWENATTLSSGMFDLLLFAYCVRCLLEFRISRRESWLLRAALVYAAAATDNWVLIALAPAFLAALIWMQGFAFFQLHFLARLFLCTLVGLLFYLFLPLLHLRSDGLFWLALKANVGAQFSQIHYLFRYAPHHVQFLVVMTSLLPILVIAIRWRSSFGDTSQLGIAMATWIFHLTYLALLALCVWAAFDTGFGLRDAQERFPTLTNNRDRLLPLYFLGALSIGYLSGYFLLVFRPVSRRSRRVPGQDKFPRAVSTGIICALLVLAPLGLLYKNVPEIRLTNGPILKNYAALLAEELPTNAVVLSDTPDSLFLTREWLARSGKASDCLFLETHAFKSPAYYRFQTRLHPEQWLQLPTNIDNNSSLGDLDMKNIVLTLSKKHPIYYLQPSFGYYFENFYTIPHGIAYQLLAYTTNTEVFPPPLPDAVFADNETFWKEHLPEMRSLIPAITPPTSAQDQDFRHRWLNAMHIPFEKNLEAARLGAVYSRALNSWGVAAQRMGRLDAAHDHFEQALDFYSDNVVARANSDFNRKLRAGEQVPVENPSAFEERFGKFNGWEQILNQDGLFDEPTGCLAQGIVFARGNLYREAAQNLLRSLALAPQSLLARLWLARVYVVVGFPNKAFPLLDELKTHSDAYADAAITPADVFQVELSASERATNSARIERLLTTALSHTPPDTTFLDTASHVCVYYQDFSNALVIVDKQLETSPNDPTRLVNKGFVEIELTNFDAAIPPLSKAISLEPTNSTALLALLCRAFSYSHSGKLDEAQRDYEAMQKLNPKAPSIPTHLAEISLRKKDTNAAIQYYQTALTNVPPNSPDAKTLAGLIKGLKTGPP